MAATYTVTFYPGYHLNDGKENYNYKRGQTYTDVPEKVVEKLKDRAGRKDTIAPNAGSAIVSPPGSPPPTAKPSDG